MDMEVLVEWVGKFLGGIFGTQNERAVRRYWKLVRERKLEVVKIGRRTLVTAEALRGVLTPRAAA